ncbi:MAG: AAA family ATPase [Synechococcaceae cyanobacterium SM2_3_1]|nr:AAA family ATPase [Synechococcaceae cyanobacterium SM2_3_1]
MDLFDYQAAKSTETLAPLAERMRPRTLDAFVGQSHLLGPERLLRRAIETDQLTSLILTGPPGTGKTTLARILAHHTHSHFLELDAVLAGIKEIRAAIETAREQQRYHGVKTLLFVDEVHRFNKSQQDALLPWVERGMVILVGATTENPYFAVNKALVSRSRVLQLHPLSSEELQQVAHQALTDPDRGYGKRDLEIDPEALEHLIQVANGDARTLLNALEWAVETTSPDPATQQIYIRLSEAEDAIQQRALHYDRDGDAHFDTISAFIKCLRGSDPDAALYWLARLIYAGEDPQFIWRRMLILASEDVGLADPQAITVVNSCAQAFDRIGLPEGQYTLAQAALYLATAPKSNSISGYFQALNAVKQEPTPPIPTPLQDSHRDREDLGHGQGYLYPHDYEDHWVAQSYLPNSLKDRKFYTPSDQGYEAGLQDLLAWRRAQLQQLTDASPPLD